MSSTSFLERGRQVLEEMDAYEEIAVEAMKERVVGAKAGIERDLIAACVAREMSETANKFEEEMKEKDAEINEMRDQNFAKFYGALRETREYYSRNSGVGEEDDPRFAEYNKVKRKVSELAHFSGEEVWGTYLDLNAQHSLFCNLPEAIILDYASYLRVMANRAFSQHFADKIKVKRSTEYTAYVQSVLDYLKDFWRRAYPLDDLEKELRSTAGELTSRIEDTVDHTLDLQQFDSVRSLEALGLDRLKSALKARGLKTGGDLEARARRLFAVKDVKEEEIDPKLLQSAHAKHKKSVATRLAENEKTIEFMLDRFAPVLRATLRRAERKQIRTKEEMDQEILHETYGPPEPKKSKAQTQEDDFDPLIDNTENPLYNPKNIPLGWDGKPIPFWLYKLHGLDRPFQCEICGNHTYWGLRAFEQHFTEWRHAHGMRCLRIPNTKHFHGITKMEDAIALWEQLQERSDKERFNPSRDEEYEDSEGNVLNRATFEDLARMGML